MKFAQVLALARAALFLGTAASGNRIHLANRAVSNTSTFSTNTITSPPSSSPTGTRSSGLDFCYSLYEWEDCVNHAEAIGFQPYSPYNSTLYPDNIVPPNPSLASYCGNLWTSSAAAFFSTAAITTATANGDTGINETFYKEDFSWVPTATQCCLNCTILGGAIQVMVWPTPAPSPAVRTLVDSAANFTFTSPSVYVVFESIGATDLCGSVGTTYINKTLAFEPDELSTVRNFFAASSGVSNVDLNQDYCTHATPQGAWSTFNYQDAAEGKCEDVTTSWWSYYASNDTTMYTDFADYTSAAVDPISCGFGCLGQPINSFTCVYNPCSPWVSVPTQVYDIDPQFHTCMDGIKAFFDPPHTLTPGSGLVPFSSVPPSSSSATPAGTITPVLASQTATPSPTSTLATVTASSTSVEPSTASSASVDPSTASSQSPVVPESTPSSTATPSVPADPSTASSQSPVVPESTPSSTASPSIPADPASTSTQVPVEPTTIASNDPSVASTTPTVPSDSTIIQAGTTPSIPPSSSNPPPAVTPSSIAVSQIPSGVIIGSQTITPGGSAVTISGTTFSLNPSTSLVIDGSTTALPAALLPTTPASAPPASIITTSGSTFLVVGTQTVLPSQAITISGTTYSLPPSGTAIVINGITSSPPTPAASLLTTASSTLLLIGSQTISPGSSAVTIDGTVISLASGGQSVVVAGSSTFAISAFVDGATSTGLGGVIVTIGGFGSGSSASSTTSASVAVFTGAASRRGEAGLGLLGIGVWFGVGCLMIL